VISSAMYILTHATPLLFLIAGFCVHLGWDAAGYLADKVSDRVRGPVAQPHCSGCCRERRR
jgi:hypothetical protein